MVYLLHKIFEKEMAHETEELKITSGIPSLGYNLLFNHSMSSPREGWAQYGKALIQRLVNTGNFCDIRIENARSEEEKQSVLKSQSTRNKQK